MYRIARIASKTKAVLLGAFVVAALASGLVPCAAFAAQDGASDVSAYWYNFRNSETNMAITDAKTPIDPDFTKLIWANMLGAGWSESASPQLIVDDALVATAGTNIYKLDLKTGRVIAQGAMVSPPNWAYTPLTYAEGMIIAPIHGGMQAFDAKTLESLWVYKDEPGVQALSQIVYSDGCLYTGFWSKEDEDARYVCVSAADEDPAQPTEQKSAAWTFTHKGGFYWAGGVALGDYIVVGSDDGTNGYAGDSVLRAFDKKTGQVASEITLAGMGDQRSSIAWDAARKRVYFTTKNGYFASAAFDAETGQLSDLDSVQLGARCQCTGTPVIYDDMAYVGTGFGVDQDGYFAAINIGTMLVSSKTQMEAYPQASLLLSTAYQADGFLYFYSTYNKKPGGLQLIRVPWVNDHAAPTGSNVKVFDLFDPGAYNPQDYIKDCDSSLNFRQQCICSVICGPDGTLYYKNDSGAIFAVRFNTAPDLAHGAAAFAEATVEAGQAYQLDLSPLFVDAEGDALTYQVSINGAAAVAADAAYSYTPKAAGTYKFVFTARDGAETSLSSCTVTLKVPGAGDADGTGDGDGLAKGKTFKLATAQGTFTYKVTGKKQVTLTKAASTKKAAVTVNAAKYQGVDYKVTAIGAKAFKSAKLKKVTLGANVATVGAQAFASCTSLTAFTVGKNVKKIGASAFKKASKLKKLTVKSPKLSTKATVAKALKGSSIKTVTLSGMTKAQKKKVTKAFKSTGKKGLKIK